MKEKKDLEKEPGKKTIRAILDELNLSAEDAQVRRLIRKYRGNLGSPSFSEEMQEALTPEQWMKLQEEIQKNRNK